MGFFIVELTTSGVGGGEQLGVVGVGLSGVGSDAAAALTWTKSTEAKINPTLLIALVFYSQTRRRNHLLTVQSMRACNINMAPQQDKTTTAAPVYPQSDLPSRPVQNVCSQPAVPRYTGDISPFAGATRLGASATWLVNACDLGSAEAGTPVGQVC